LTYVYRGEARPGKNITIRDNVFYSCNEGIAQQEGVICLLPDPVQLSPVLIDININNNTFIQGENSLQMIQDYNGVGVSVKDNYIQYTGVKPPVAICNSQNVTVSHNCLVGQNITSDYVMDKSSICDPTLSGGLMFAADAFSASFRMPVIPSPSGYGVIVVNSDYRLTNRTNKLLGRDVCLHDSLFPVTCLTMFECLIELFLSLLHAKDTNAVC